MRKTSAFSLSLPLSISLNLSLHPGSKYTMRRQESATRKRNPSKIAYSY
jgi:hypothetical protein